MLSWIWRIQQERQLECTSLYIYLIPASHVIQERGLLFISTELYHRLSATQFDYLTFSPNIMYNHWNMLNNPAKSYFPWSFPPFSLESITYCVFGILYQGSYLNFIYICFLGISQGLPPSTVVLLLSKINLFHMYLVTMNNFSFSIYTAGLVYSWICAMNAELEVSHHHSCT